jgi:hypothetical protein
MNNNSTFAHWLTGSGTTATALVKNMCLNVRNGYKYGTELDLSSMVIWFASQSVVLKGDYYEKYIKM